jgi:hypothetical protein
MTPLALLMIHWLAFSQAAVIFLLMCVAMVIARHSWYQQRHRHH